MSDNLPVMYLARHGETIWSLSDQHTGPTDLPLTEHGECAARRIGEYLKGLMVAVVWTNPLQRAARTYELAGFRAVAEVDRDLTKWDYGQYEGLRTAEIRAERPNWGLFVDGCPGGESPGQVSGGLTVSDVAYGRFRGTRCGLRASILFWFVPPAGPGLNRRPIASTSC
ncbi:MAG: histidine phosphatase family protein [Nitrospira sp.]